MVFKNITCTLFIIFSCITVSFVNAGKKKISRAKMSTQYRASSNQIINFLSRQTLNKSVVWQDFLEDYRNNRVTINDLMQVMNKAFQEAAQNMRLDDRSTVLHFLNEAFGSSKPEQEFMEVTVHHNIEKHNQDRNRAGLKKWKQSPHWPACTNLQTAQKILCSISQALGQFFEKTQCADAVPEFWIVVTNLKAGNDFTLKIDCITDIPLLEEQDDTEYIDVAGYSNCLMCCYYAQQCCCYGVLPIVVGAVVGGVLTANFL